MARVADYYDLTKYAFIPTHPLFGLARVAGAIYIPRLLAIKMRQAAERANNARDVTPKAPLAAPPHTPPPPRGVDPQPAAQTAPQRQQPTMGPIPPARPMAAGADVVVKPKPIPGFEGIEMPNMKIN